MLDVLRRLREVTPEVIVGLSRGKDSLVLLDLCREHFERVECYCMTLVPGISFVEDYLGYLERRYSITVHRTPHWWLSRAYREAAYRPLRVDVPLVTIRDVEESQRERTGIDWHATGQKACDSLQRRGMLSACGGIDPKARVGYPLAWWTDRQVYSHLRRRNVPLPPDYRLFGGSFSCQLDGRTLSLLQEHYPEDYARVLEVFPFAEAAVWRYRLGRDPVAARRTRNSFHRGRAPGHAPPPGVPGADQAVD